VSYDLNPASARLDISLAAANREELVRDIITALLVASYRGAAAAAPGAAADSLVVPIQASGRDEQELLTHLVADTLRAVSATDGVLGPPRWLAFDEKRVTANLPILPGSVRPRDVPLAGRRPAVTIESDFPAFRATVSLSTDARAA
jgi:hypothetical protein